MTLENVEIYNKEIFNFLATHCCINLLVSDPQSAEQISLLVVVCGATVHDIFVLHTIIVYFLIWTCDFLFHI